ncbi:MAG: hypothetical protein Q7K29_08230 [Thermoleophilia bacterium]|nr:hypothetical protein [Thermoleophilia bacterium]
MSKKLITAIIMLMAGLGALILLAGCGEEKTIEQPQVPDFSTTNAEADLNAKINELKKKEMSVEVVTDGQSQGKWTQDGKGSWRQDDASSTSSYTIYNADQQKGWVVSGKTATEIDPSTMQMYEVSSPLLLLSAYSSFSAIPQTGGGSDDVWEWNVPGLGSLKIEFKGPDGAISKITSNDSTSGDSVIEFKYTDVGNVSKSMFEQPSEVTEDSTGGNGFSGGSVTVPDASGTSTSSLPQY